MASLNQQLQDYLKSQSSDSVSRSNGEGGGGYMSWFKGSSDPSTDGDITIDESANGWFGEAQKDPLLPSLSKKQRIFGFVGCVLMGLFCFTMASLYLPFLILKARKFALMYSLGSLFFVFSFSFLWGPTNHVKHLFSGQRILFSTAYFGSLFATLYCALVMRSTLFTICAAIFQIGALVWYIVSYIPGGQTGLKFFTKIFYSACSKTVQKTLPV
ncbi:protein transport protein SFT2 [Lingula anatina]|uniref:Vesicle transport protein n=1 Tax=Lingula anatina TaxID=7574 RepID=A0A1S3JLZ6_LINAN|nr:protein transport protein SFT2 [Lingula anatina]|eukprot:XP_013411408.1 protein transport protein SFT2 [Lingula anatina]